MSKKKTSVLLVKWIILFAIVCIIMPETCQASMPVDLREIQANNTQAIGDRTSNVLRSLMSLLHFNAADLTQEVSHTTVDKKAFIYILLHQKYSSSHHPEYTQDPLTTQDLLFTGPEQTAYYIYALHKIVV